MASSKKSLSRKDFIKQSSIGILGAGMMAGIPIKLSAGARRLNKSKLGNTGIKLTKLGVGAPRINAVKWILEQPYIHAAAVAMASFSQLDDHLSMMKV